MVHDLSDRSKVVFDRTCRCECRADAGCHARAAAGARGTRRCWRRLGSRPGAARPGRKVLSLIHAMMLGADCIDDCDVLRAGRTEAVLGHRAMAPSTLGTFLRSFTFGHVRQLDRVFGQLLRRAWAAGAGPGAARLIIDVDSFIGEVHGHAKQGASYGYTRRLGYHPLLATRAGTNEVLHVRLRTGKANSQRGAVPFVNELLARVRRAGAAGEILFRADSGFWNKKVTAGLRTPLRTTRSASPPNATSQSGSRRSPTTPGSRSRIPTRASASSPRRRSDPTG